MPGDRQYCTGPLACISGEMALHSATSDEPTALIIGMPVAKISPGTIRNPPPTPNKPVMRPVTEPTEPSTRAVKGVQMNLPVSPWMRAQCSDSEDSCAKVALDCLKNRALTPHKSTPKPIISPSWGSNCAQCWPSRVRGTPHSAISIAAL